MPPHTAICQAGFTTIILYLPRVKVGLMLIKYTIRFQHNDGICKYLQVSVNPSPLARRGGVARGRRSSSRRRHHLPVHAEPGRVEAKLKEGVRVDVPVLLTADLQLEQICQDVLVWRESDERAGHGRAGEGAGCAAAGFTLSRVLLCLGLLDHWPCIIPTPQGGGGNTRVATGSDLLPDSRLWPIVPFNFSANGCSGKVFYFASCIRLPYRQRFSLVSLLQL